MGSSSNAPTSSPSSVSAPNAPTPPSSPPTLSSQSSFDEPESGYLDIETFLWGRTVRCLSSRRIASCSFWRLVSSWATHDGSKTRTVHSLPSGLPKIQCTMNPVLSSFISRIILHQSSHTNVKYLQQKFSLCGRKDQDC